MASLVIVQETLKALLKKADDNDWFSEREGFMGVSARTLRRFRERDQHKDGWRAKGTGNGRRNIIWSKKYLLKHYFAD